MVVSFNLYTRNPEKIKEVIPCAIEETKVQSLKDVFSSSQFMVV
jgi:hypothetical protein